MPRGKYTQEELLLHDQNNSGNIKIALVVLRATITVVYDINVSRLLEGLLDSH